jgi:hypothetical protein
MGLNLRYFMIAEAEALLPQIEADLRAALDTKSKIEEKVDGWRKIHKTISAADEAVVRGQVDFLAARLEEQLGKIAELGCVPKDLDKGLVDFPARIDGKEGYLCWQFGEDRIRFWHGLTDGFAGRKPLPGVEGKQ